jgi:hypothetical protein
MREGASVFSDIHAHHTQIGGPSAGGGVQGPAGMGVGGGPGGLDLNSLQDLLAATAPLLGQSQPQQQVPMAPVQQSPMHQGPPPNSGAVCFILPARACAGVSLRAPGDCKHTLDVAHNLSRHRHGRRDAGRAAPAPADAPAAASAYAAAAAAAAARGLVST